MKNQMIFAALMLVSSVSFAEPVTVIVVRPPHATSEETTKYAVRLEPQGAETNNVLPLIPMTKEVLETIRSLSSGKHDCEGLRFKGQIFELSHCD